MLDFLDHHRLGHQSEHYAFTHAYLSGGATQLQAEVDRVTDGGVRLTAAHVRQLASMDVLATAGTSLRALAPTIDHVALRVLDLVGDALTNTSDSSRDFVTTSASVVDADAADIAALVAYAWWL